MKFQTETLPAWARTRDAVTVRNPSSAACSFFDQPRRRVRMSGRSKQGRASMHADPEPSRWITRFAPLVRPGAPILDLACGGGRHARYFVARGHPVAAVDVDVSGLEDLQESPELELVAADLEDGSPWPLPGRRFGAVVVTNYLWRPLFPPILESIDEGGLLLYETFARGNEAYGHPRNPDFLLEPGELIEVVRGRLQIVAYEHGYVERPRPAVRQRLCAVRTDRPVHLYSSW